VFAHAERTLTDQPGRQVTLPDRVTRVVVLQHQTLNLLVQLNAADDVVGVLSSWKKQPGAGFARLNTFPQQPRRAKARLNRDTVLFAEGGQ